MEKFEFSVIASGIDHEADDFEDRFFEAGCDDATIGFSRGSIILHFAREAVSLNDAIQSAIGNVRAAGAHVDRIEPDHLVSLSEIAARSGLTRAAATNYAKGERGKGFPHPIARVTSESPLWDWVEVAEWLAERGNLRAREVEAAKVVRDHNLSLLASARRAEVGRRFA